MMSGSEEKVDCFQGENINSGEIWDSLGVNTLQDRLLMVSAEESKKLMDAYKKKYKIYPYDENDN
jgi:hypothetical protein